MVSCEVRQSRISFTLLLIVSIIIYLQINSIKCFQVGHKYVYSYINDIEIRHNTVYYNNSNDNQEASNKVSFSYEVHLDALSNEPSNNNVFVRLKIYKDNNFTPIGLNYDISEVLSKFPILFKYNLKSKRIEKIYYSSQDSIGSLNFKKGICDILNLNWKASEEVGTVGRCDLTIDADDTANKHIRKNKSNCYREILYNDEFKRHDEVLDTKIYREIKLDYYLSDDNTIIKSVKSIDDLKFTFVLNSNSFRDITTKQSLNLKETIETNKKVDLSNINSLSKQQPVIVDSDSYDSVTDTLLLEKINAPVSDTGNKDVASYIKKLLKSLKKELPGSKNSCNIFLELVKLLRNKNVDIKLLDKINFKKFLKNEQLSKFIIDLLVAAQTPSSLETIASTVELNRLNEKLDKKSSYIIEKFLRSSSLCSHSTLKELSKHLSDACKIDGIYNPKLKSLAILAWGSIIKNAFHIKDAQHQQLVQDYLSFVIRKISECKDQDCKAFYLNSLANSNSKESISIFENEVQNCNKNNAKACVISLKSLKTFNPTHFSSSLFPIVFELFQKYSNYSENNLIRLEALNLLLNTFENETLNDNQLIDNILYTIYDDNKPPISNYEFTLYAQKSILSKLRTSKKFKNRIQKMYDQFFTNIIQVNGSSEFLSGSLLNTPDGQFYYKFRQLSTVPDGIMKSLIFSLDYANKNEKLDFLMVIYIRKIDFEYLNNYLIYFFHYTKFDVYTENLDSSGLLSAGAGGDPTAGLELSIMGTKVMEKEFFRGYSSLIQMAWNAPADLTSVFDLTFLLNDHNEYTYLQNGFIVKSEALGAFSLDVSGSAEISMWNKYANTLVETNIAYKLETNHKLYDGIHLNEFANLQYSVSTDLTTDFHTDVNFKKDPLELCIKVLVDKIKLDESFKMSKLNENNNKIWSNKHTTTIQPLTYMLSRKATTLCNKINE